MNRSLTALRLQFHSNLSQTNFWLAQALTSLCLHVPNLSLVPASTFTQNHFSELNQKTPNHWRELEKYPSALTMHQNRLGQVLASTRAPSEAATQYISPGYHQTTTPMTSLTNRLDKQQSWHATKSKTADSLKEITPLEQQQAVSLV